jgi:hypothetical protein
MTMGSLPEQRTVPSSRITTFGLPIFLLLWLVYGRLLWRTTGAGVVTLRAGTLGRSPPLLLPSSPLP